MIRVCCIFWGCRRGTGSGLLCWSLSWDLPRNMSSMNRCRGTGFKLQLYLGSLSVWPEIIVIPHGHLPFLALPLNQFLFSLHHLLRFLSLSLLYFTVFFTCFSCYIVIYLLFFHSLVMPPDNLNLPSYHLKKLFYSLASLSFQKSVSTLDAS